MVCVNPTRCNLTACLGEQCNSFIKAVAYPGLLSMVPTRTAPIREFTNDELLAEIKRRMGT
jgi:hypothetical protein